MIELLYQHACYVKISYRFSCTTGIAIHTTWKSDHLTATSNLCIKHVVMYIHCIATAHGITNLLQQIRLHVIIVM